MSEIDVVAEVELMHLPDHILAKILSYIPDHYEVSSVCRKFYELDCFNYSKSKVKVTLKLDEAHEELQENLDSILSSKRKIHKIVVNGHNKIKDLRKIFKRHGASVMELKFGNDRVYERPVKLSERTLIELLNLFPNLSTLELKSIDIQESEKMTRVMRLPELEEVAIYPVTLNFFAKNLQESLFDVSLDFCDSEETDGPAMENLLEKLSSMELISLMIFDDDSPHRISWPALKSLLTSQRNCLQLITLSNIDPNFQNELMLELENLTELEYLNVDQISPESFQSFSQLTKLKSLTLDTFLDELSLITSVPVEELTLTYPPNIDILQQIGENYPLKSLTIWEARESLKFFMQIFPRLESLTLQFQDEANLSWKISGIHVFDRIRYPGLKSLNVSAKLQDETSDFFFEMLDSFPNLEDLSLIGNIKISGSFFSSLRKSIGKVRIVEISNLIIEMHEFCTEESIQALQELSKVVKSINFAIKISSSMKNGKYDEHFNRLRGYYRIKFGKSTDKYTFTLKALKI